MGVPGQRLVERVDELRQVEEVLDRAAGGAGTLALVAGPPGIGKTSVLGAAARSATHRGMELLRVRAAELEQDFAFGVVRTLLGPLAARRPELLAGPAAHAAEVLREAPEAAPSSPGAAELYPRLDALHWLIAGAAAERPLAIVVDDAHWADDASLAWLAYLARRADEHPLALLAGIRTTELAPRDELRAVEEAATLRISPSPLSASGIGELLEAHLGAAPEPPFVEACARATGGNPFAVAELTREVAARGIAPIGASAAEVAGLTPDTLSRSIVRRLVRLPPELVRLAEAVAVLGEAATLDEAAALAGMRAESASAAAAGLARAAILEDAVPLRFVHPLVRSSVAAQVGSARRAEAHRRAAILLRERGAGAERIAAQLMEAEPGLGTWAAEVLREVAEGAASRGASGSAVALLARAAREPAPEHVRARILGTLGMHELRIGRHVEAVEHLKEAAGAAADVAERSMFSRELAMAYLSIGRFAPAGAAVERALAELEGAERELALRLEGELLMFSWFLDPIREAMADRAERRTDVIEGRTPGERLVLAARTFFLWRRTALTPEEVVAHAERAMAGGRLFREQATPDGPLAYMLAYQLLAHERFETVAAVADAALEDARARGSVVGIAAALSLRASVAQPLGRLRDAQADGEASLRAALEIDWVPGRPTLIHAVVRAHLDSGDVAAAADALRRAGYEQHVPSGGIFLKARLARVEVALAEGRAQDALAFGILDDAERDVGATSEQAKAIASEALRLTGDVERANEMALRAVEQVRDAGAPAAGMCLALRTLARTLPAREALPVLEEALAAGRRTPSVLQRAGALVELGAVLRRLGRRSDARDHLLEGLELAHGCGALPLGQRAREELHSLGLRPRRAARTGIDALTASELRVVRLAADGLSNPEIAQALFLSRKTVEMHLGRAYRKLDITSREELPRLAPVG